MDSLPIDEVLPQLRDALRASRNAVLSAEPGAGKTTRVPIALLEEHWLESRKLMMLEPRRLAAQRAAQFMASLIGERVGETIGYRIRGESRVSGATRVEVVTEGVLTRILQREPELPGVALVVFDEFHERSIHADLGLALTLDVQAHLREDLRILVMSATLDGLAVSSLLGDAPLIQGAGRTYPVVTHYLHFAPAPPIEPRVADAVLRAIEEEPGDLLVFLPGQREIRRVQGLLADAGLPATVSVQTLYSEAVPEQQRAALAPAKPGARKVILSTSIAETSLTIDGVRIVVDAGLARGPQFDPRRGMTGLVTTRVSMASADQRRGRAGRQGPGVCYRLWTEEQHAALSRFLTPEILAADLAPLALDLAQWGVPEGEGLRFLDPPPRAHLAQARSLLKSLGALDDRGVPTDHGRAMAGLPVHPRLAHMVIRGVELGLGSMACEVAALLEERDLLRGRDRADVDLFSRWHALRSGAGADRGVRERVLAETKRLREIAGIVDARVEEDRLGLLLATAYPDRLARRRGKEGRRYQMVKGTGAVLPEWSLLAREEFLAVGEVDGIGTEVRIFLASPVEKSDLLEVYSDQIVTHDEVTWSPGDEAVLARRVQRLDTLVITEQVITPHGDAQSAAMLQGVIQMGLGCLPWDRASASFRERSEWLRSRHLVADDWPDLSDARLLDTLPVWLGPYLGGINRRSHLTRLNLHAILQGLFSHRQVRDLDRLAPETLTVPTGSRIRLEYAAESTPVLAVRLQEMLGQRDTPTVAGGKVNVMIHLLSPAGRPLAVTQDLPSFWQNAYPEVRKQMRGRYPKHIWPEDPLNAEPTRRTRR